MFKYIILVFFLLSSVISACKLQSTYYYDSALVTSKSIDPECPNDFAILRIPEEKISYRIDANLIAKTFELHATALDIPDIRYVTFVKRSPIDLQPYKEQLESLLHSHYDAIRIDDITITPRGYVESLPKNSKAVFDQKTFLNAKGTFYVSDSDGLRRYMDYTVNATIKILHTARKVSRKEELNPANCEIKSIAMTSFKDIPLTRFSPDTHRFRTSLNRGTLLTVRNVEAIPLVQRNDKVTVSIRNGLVVVEFTAVAMQEGSLYDIITIQKNDGKRVKAKVIGEKRVELQ